MKKRYRNIAISLVLAGLITGTAYAKSAGVIAGVEVQGWYAALDGTVRGTEGGIVGSTVEIDDDLGLDNEETIPLIRTELNIFNSRFVLSYFSLKAEGNTSLGNPIWFNGRTYAGGSTVSTTVQLQQAEAFYEILPLKLQMGEIGLLVGAKYFKADTELSNETAGFSEREAITAPLPIIGAQAEISVTHGFSIGAEVKAMRLDLGEVNVGHLDATAMLSYDLNRWSRVSTGYRYFLLEAEDGEDKVDVSFSGPYLSVTASF